MSGGSATVSIDPLPIFWIPVGTNPRFRQQCFRLWQCSSEAITSDAKARPLRLRIPGETNNIEVYSGFHLIFTTLYALRGIWSHDTPEPKLKMRHKANPAQL